MGVYKNIGKDDIGEEHDHATIIKIRQLLKYDLGNRFLNAKNIGIAQLQSQLNEKKEYQGPNNPRKGLGIRGVGRFDKNILGKVYENRKVNDEEQSPEQIEPINKFFLFVVHENVLIVKW